MIARFALFCVLLGVSAETPASDYTRTERVCVAEENLTFYDQNGLATSVVRCKQYREVVLDCFVYERISPQLPYHHDRRNIRNDRAEVVCKPRA